MLSVNNRLEIETVYTYDEWLKEYNRREMQRKIKKTEHLYYMKQKFCGLVMSTIGIVLPFILNGDATIALFALPLGIFLLLTKERVVMF